MIPNLVIFNNKRVLSQHFPWASNLGTAFFKVWWDSNQIMTGLHSSEDLTGAVRSSSKMAHSHGCWEEVSFPSHEDLSRISWMLSLSPEQASKREHGESHVFHDVALEVIQCHSPNILKVTGKPNSMWEETARAWPPGLRDHCGHLAGW